MNTKETVRRVTEALRQRQVVRAATRSYCDRLWRYCDNLEGPPVHILRVSKNSTALAGKDIASSTQKSSL